MGQLGPNQRLVWNRPTASGFGPRCRAALLCGGALLCSTTAHLSAGCWLLGRAPVGPVGLDQTGTSRGWLGHLEWRAAQGGAAAAAVARASSAASEVWKDAVGAERERAQLLLSQYEEIDQNVEGTQLEVEARDARALCARCDQEDFSVELYEDVKACNDRLQKGLQLLKEIPEAPSSLPSWTPEGMRLAGIEVVVEPLPPVAESDGVALIAGAPHVQVQLPLGYDGALMWGCDLTPLFDEAGERLIVLNAVLPMGMTISSVPRPPNVPQAPGSLLVVEAVEASGEAEAAGIRKGDYIRAVSCMGPGLEPGFFDALLGAQAVPMPRVEKVDGFSVEEVQSALASNGDSPEGVATLLLERPP